MHPVVSDPDGPQPLVRLRRGRIGIARLLLAAMILPLWLSLMAMLLPSSAAALPDADAGAQGVLCVYLPDEGTKDGEHRPALNPPCVACKGTGCTMMAATSATAGQGLAVPVTGPPVLGTAAAASPRSPARPSTRHSRAPPVA